MCEPGRWLRLWDGGAPAGAVSGRRRRWRDPVLVGVRSVGGQVCRRVLQLGAGAGRDLAVVCWWPVELGPAMAGLRCAPLVLRGCFVGGLACLDWRTAGIFGRRP